MLQPPLIQTVDTNFMGLCPAAVQIDGHGNPTFLINRLTFPAADPFAQRFYLAHELGHWLLATDNEQPPTPSHSPHSQAPNTKASKKASQPSTASTPSPTPASTHSTNTASPSTINTNINP